MRNNELDEQLLSTLLDLREQGHEVTFVTKEPGMAALVLCLQSDSALTDNVNFKSREDLSEELKHADILIDDEAERNMATYAIEADEILVPETAAAVLKQRFSGHAPSLAPAPL
ncbi:MAG: hypothetical protein AB7E85_00325 [Pseudobdellovibrionaceae bacterium]